MSVFDELFDEMDVNDPYYITIIKMKPIIDVIEDLKCVMDGDDMYLDDESKVEVYLYLETLELSEVIHMYRSTDYFTLRNLFGLLPRFDPLDAGDGDDE